MMKAKSSSTRDTDGRWRVHDPRCSISTNRGLSLSLSLSSSGGGLSPLGLTDGRMDGGQRRHMELRLATEFRPETARGRDSR